MKKTIYSIVFIFALHVPVFGQQYAGEEKVACGSTGAVIGVDNPNSNWCYIWEIAEGLNPADKNSSNPLVTPNQTTTYRCTVTDQNFSFKATDQVKVKVAFGGLEFQPRFILPNGEMNQSQAILNLNEPLTSGGEAGTYTWSIADDPDGTNCSIDPQTGWISGCDSGGSVKIRATRDNNPDCKAEKNIEVNIGVKELIVRDLAHAGREAKSDDTLWITNSGPIEFEAVPNEGTSFPSGQPDWSGDLTATNDIVWSTSLISPGTYSVTAGDKTVYVKRDVESTLDISLTVDLRALDTLAKKVEKVGPPLVSPLCTPIPVSVTVPGMVTGSLKITNVPKYQNPDLANKIQILVSVPGFGAAGCAPLLPCCGFVIPGTNIVGFTYFRAAGGLAFGIDVTKDPSMANNDFTGEVNINGFVEMGVGVTVDAALGPAGISGAGEAFTKAEGKVRIKDQKLEYQLGWNGLQFQAAGLAYFGTPANPTPIASVRFGPYNIIEGAKTDWVLIKDLSEFFE